MKTQKIKSLILKAGFLLSLFVICILFTACPPSQEIVIDAPEPEVYSIGPEGGIILSQNNQVFIRVPEGAILVPTEMKINYKGGIKYGSYILMDKGYSISIGDQQLVKPITIRLNYSPEELCLGTNDEHCLKIYAYRSTESGIIHKSDCFQPEGDCCVDENNRTVEACFNELGNFIVGIKH
ncbi:MAG: hypothetical protein QNK30_12955 [Bacteroidales bacterium]|nr:hypothetical protein [Bacteroidales bacterium]